MTIQMTSGKVTWTDDGAYKKTTQFSGRMQIAYTGDEALLTIGTGPDHGMIDISINDWFWRSFNTYATTPAERVIHLPQVPTLPGETSGTLEIRNHSDRHRRSTGYVFRFKQLAVIDATYNERTIDYTYDGLSRLLTANYDGGTVEYTYGYDLAGNLTNMNGATRTYNAANQMTNDGTNTLTYDANGNLTNDGTNSYTWDRANRMLTAPNNTSYTYDGLGNRVSQTVGTTATNYLLDLQPGLVKVLRQSDGTNTNHYIHSVRGIHAQSDGTNWQYITQDGLGSVRSLIDSTLGVDSTHTYDPYGNYIGTAPTTAYFGFTGEQTDSNGQMYLRARYYDPSLGVFNSLDFFEGTMGRPMSLNGYSWVEGNVPNMADPTGMDAALANRLNSDLCNSQPQPECSSIDDLISANLLIPDTFMYPISTPEIDPDAAMGEYNSLGNRLFLKMMYTLWYESVFRLGSGVMAMMGRNMAASHMLHYLDGTGEPRFVDVDQLLSDVPEIASRVSDSYDGQIKPEIEKIARQIYDGTSCQQVLFEPSIFGNVSGTENGWVKNFNTYAGQNSSGAIADWFYGLGAFYYGYSGAISITPIDENNFTLNVCYVVNLYDRYDWHPELNANFGLITVPDTEPGFLHLFGTAREYDILGVSSFRCDTFSLSL